MTVVVIGGGFSGAMTAAHLAARGIETIAIEPAAIEPGAFGRGLAYARTGEELVLNTPSAAMSALPDQPDHFVRWLAGRGSTATFAPRATYGDYLEATIGSLRGRSLEIVPTRATAIRTYDRPGDRPGRGFRVRCENGRTISARVVVLALGNAPPRPLPALGSAPRTLPPGNALSTAIDHARFSIDDPYRAASAIDRDAAVAVIGTGLTAFDVIASLRMRGHRGPIIAASRRGLIPQTFSLGSTEPVDVPRELVRQPRLGALIAWWRSRRLYGIADPAIAIALRPHLPMLWRRLPIADRERFVRHIRPHWEVVRHRAPPAIATIVHAARLAGTLELETAALVASATVGDRLRCTFVTPAKTMLVRDVDHVINCTGPDRDVARHRAPLVRSLLASGMIERDRLGLGVDTIEHGQLLSRGGPVAGAYAVGPWRIADLWESTAVPELRVQAANTAEAIARELAEPERARRAS